MRTQGDDMSGKVEQRFCDVVMKGGITSGTVYPRAISALGGKYCFKNIGGTSAGAIAAAAAAAAEYRRRHTGTLDGFDTLDKLPGELGKTDKRKRSRLLRLFQPQSGTRPLFSMLLAGLDRRSATSRVLHVVLAGFFAFWFSTLCGAAVLGGIAWWTSHAWTPTALLALVGALAGFGVGLYRCLSREVVGNGFGLCRGFDKRRASASADEEELTPWLHRLINEVAGRKAEDAPLTFGDLWDADGFPPDWMSIPKGTPVKSINLQMMTTNLTHGRPYTLPFTDLDARLFFDPEELKKYFPEKVVEWMVKAKAKYEPTESDPKELAGRLLQLPEARYLPVIFAARLSLSFPLLISAVPLWAIDYEHKRGERSFQRCWFSDGGISSNFPVHLFDDLLPLWPTFGLKLEGFPKGYANPQSNRIYMPSRNEEGWADGWDRFDDGSGFARLAGFLNAIIDAMMNWNDNTLARLPGYRDRIVRIRLKDDEGGMNLSMGSEKVKALSGYGAAAGAEIVRRFVLEEPVGKDQIVMGLENHRWIRLRSLMAILEETVPQLRDVMHKVPPGELSYVDQVKGGAARKPAQFPLDAAQTATITKAISEIAALATTISRPPPSSGNAPRPLPSLRTRPKNI